MSNRNTLANKKKRREERTARKAAFWAPYEARKAYFKALMEELGKDPETEVEEEAVA